MRVLEREDAAVYFGRAGCVQGVRAVLQRTHRRARKSKQSRQCGLRPAHCDVLNSLQCSAGVELELASPVAKTYVRT